MNNKFCLKHIENLSKQDAKDYVIKFFIPLTNGNHAFLNNGKYEIYNEELIKKTYFKRMDKFLTTFYFEEYKDLRTVVYEINKPILFDDKLNLCPSFLHEYKPFKSFSSEIKNKVFLKYTQTIICLLYTSELPTIYSV